jgi:hypothetical protein
MRLAHETHHSKQSDFTLSGAEAALRRWLILWLYGLALSHFVGGILFAWCAHFAWFNDYHYAILSRFWHADIPLSAQALNLWWINLFGATLQNLAIFMGALTYLGNHYRSAFVWGWMIIGLITWAPQDILISLQVDMWLHVWVDSIMLMLMLPPLIILWCFDRNTKS